MTEDLLQRIAADIDSAPAYLAYADALIASADPHGELIKLQLELETARGDRAVQLIGREAEILADPANAESLFGPLAAFSIKHPHLFGWYRGFITQVTLPHSPWYDRGEDNRLPPQPAYPTIPFGVLEEAMAHPSLRFCHSLTAPF